jgi:chemotaxis protein methyltransferase CheR
MLVNLLTTSETYFYREFPQIELCIDIIKEKKTDIKILSAPCASGEEPYSLLIAMLEANINLENIQIYAIDINTKEIEKAGKGIFPHRRLHKLSSTLQNKYFTVLDDGNYQISPQLQKHVHFKQMNLFEPFPREYSDFDVIFSRNVLIYFDQKSQEKAEEIFYNMLKVEGLLFVGHADKIHKTTALKAEILKGIPFYRK